MSVGLAAPQTFLVGHSEIDWVGLQAFLEATGNEEFIYETSHSPSSIDTLCSMYAKLCYSSLTEGKNANIQSVRSIPDNIRSTLAHGHGSVFEHVMLNFVTIGCSRVFTHELIRHRVGTAYSQQSGRYVRSTDLELVADPLITSEPDVEKTLVAHLHEVQKLYRRLEMYYGLVPPDEEYKASGAFYHAPVKDMKRKKMLTSLLRRILPEGRANQMGWSINIRALRHTLMVRTSRHAEWEIRCIFNQVWKIVYARWPSMFQDAEAQEVDGLLEITGMVLQPYEVQA